MPDRWEILHAMFPASGNVLEVGPLARGVAPRRDGYSVTIVDHADAAGLRAKYRDDANVETSLIEDVDFVWDGRPIDEVVGRPGHYDAVIASHVIEHVPDMIGFLLACERLLADDGVLVLAVPDHRRCFDVTRPLSTLGSILQAHAEERATHPSGIAYDNVAYMATLDGNIGWHKDARGRPEPVHTFEAARTAFRAARADPHRYQDYHGWVFCPSSFRLAVEELHAMGNIGLRERRVEPSDGNEFYVALSRDGPGPGMTAWDLVVATLMDEQAALVATALPARDPEGTTREAADVASAEQQQQAVEERLRDDLEGAHERIREFEGSTSWRITAPMRTVGSRIRTWRAARR